MIIDRFYKLQKTEKMEVEDFYTGEKKEIVIPEGCIMIDEEKYLTGTML